MAFTELRSPKQVEDAAIAFVIAQEEQAHREVHDTRHRGAVADLGGDRVIEVKAFGTTSRGETLWLEPKQYEAAKADPDHFWLYVVENVRQGDPTRFRLLRLGGERLRQLIAGAKERRYYEVPFPVAAWDAALQQGD